MARPRRFPWSRRAPADTTVVRGAPRRAVREDYVEEGPPPPPAGPPPREWWPWLLALALLVVGALVGWLIFHNSGGSGTTTTQGTAVPSVIGLTEVKATARITQAGLRSQIKRQTSKKAKDTVISQSPAAGAHVDPGAVVTMIVSAGRSGVAVPNVVGLRTAAAVTKLRAAGFKAKASEVFSTKPSGTVVAQVPAAADRADKGSQVKLQVSKGQKRAQVPDVVGQPSADAQAALKTAGFAYTIVVVPSDQARGTVVSQAPAGGTTAPQGSKVRLNVASGTGGGATGTGSTTATTTTAGSTTTAPTSVAVPRVVGLNQTVAQRRLQAVGLTSNVVYVASTQPAGRVVAQRPAPGTKVKRGSRVRINVSTGPNPQAARAVPDVVGQDEATATTTLQNAGFVVEVIDQPTTDQTQDGIVLDEQPAGGTRAPRGSVVTIYVGRFSG
jgi:beta-lactam-binding protein with PASTA domain